MTDAAKIGRIGQTSLEKWAAQAGMTANPSFHDERGWDALVQVGSDEQDGAGPLDRAPPQTSCMIQIKTTCSQEQSEPILLSNWQRMCSDPIPWFVLAIHLGKDLEPQKAYLVHIDEIWCERVLRRLRELDPSERSRLNKHTISVTWSKKDRLHELHGRELLRLVRNYVHPNQRDYVERKMRWFDDLGYEDRRRRIAFSFQASNPDIFWQELADLGVGARTTLPGEWRARVSDIRFGIEGTLKEFGREKGDMEFRTPSQGNAVVEVFSEAEFAPPLTCQYFRARAVFPFLPPEFEKLRLASTYVTILVERHATSTHAGLAITFHFEIPAEEPVPLGSMDAISRTMRVAANASMRPVSVRVTTSAGSVTFAPDQAMAMDASHLELLDTIERSVRICRAFALPDSTPVIIADLHERRQWVLFMSTFFDGKPGTLVAPYKSPVPIGSLFAATTECVVDLPNQRLAVFAGIYGAVTESDEVADLGAKVTVDDAAVVVERVVIVEGTEKGALEAARAAVLQRLRALGCTSISNHRDEETRRRTPST